MAQQKLGRILKLLCVCLGIIVLTASFSFGAEVDKSEEQVIIEGEDRQPAESTFDYNTQEGDTSAPFEETQLRKNPSKDKPTELEDSDQTAVNEFSAFELMLIGIGIVAVAASL